MVAKEQLHDEGWKIKPEFFEGPGKGLNKQELIKALLKCDLKDTRCPTAPSELQKNESNQLPTPIVLQITNLKNVSAPKSNQESKTSPRLLKITLTDGINFVQALEVENIPSISLKTPPGAKVKLTGPVSFISGYLLLNPSNTSVLGGFVPELYSKWEMSQNVSSMSRTHINEDGTGPPPWVPFGQKIEGLDGPQKNFKALKTTVTNIKEDDEFRKQRDEAVQELVKESGNKVFGGGKQMLDTNVQKILKAGFTMEEAQRALQRSRNDLPKAMRDLKMMAQGKMAPMYEPKRGGRGRGRRGRGRRGDDDYDDTETAATKPSGPATLCDYLETKLNLPQPKEERPQPTKMSSFAESAYKEAYERQERTNRGRGRGRSRGDSSSYRGARGGQAPMQADYWPELGMEGGANENTNHKASPNHQSNQYNKQRPSRTQDHREYPGNNRHHDQRYEDSRNRRQSTEHNNYQSHSRRQEPRYQSYHEQEYDQYQKREPYQGYRNQSQGYQQPNHGRQYQGYHQYGEQQFNHSGPHASSSSNYTSKQMDLISKFKESMIISGVYEPEETTVNASGSRSEGQHSRNVYNSGYSSRGGRRGRGRGRY